MRLRFFWIMPSAAKHSPPFDWRARGGWSLFSHPNLNLPHRGGGTLVWNSLTSWEKGIEIFFRICLQFFVLCGILLQIEYAYNKYLCPAPYTHCKPSAIPQTRFRCHRNKPWTSGARTLAKRLHRLCHQSNGRLDASLFVLVLPVSPH